MSCPPWLLAGPGCHLVLQACAHITRQLCASGAVAAQWLLKCPPRATCRPCYPCSNEAGNEVALVPIAFELKHRKTAQLEAAAGRTLPAGQGIVYARQELVDNPANPGGEVGAGAQRQQKIGRHGGSAAAADALHAVSSTWRRNRLLHLRTPLQALWALAKHIFRSADSGFHQLISHWLVGGEGWGCAGALMGCWRVLPWRVRVHLSLGSA